MSERTPVEQLKGVELCERVAEAIGWTPVQRSVLEGQSWSRSLWENLRSESRVIPCDENIKQFGLYNPSESFRPDVDGNHLAEAIAEAERRGWSWSHHYTAAKGGKHITCMYRRVGDIANRLPFYTRMIEGASFNESFLRAFVAASEAEKESGA